MWCHRNEDPRATSCVAATIELSVETSFLSILLVTSLMRFCRHRLLLYTVWRRWKSRNQLTHTINFEYLALLFTVLVFILSISNVFVTVVIVFVTVVIVVIVITVFIIFIVFVTAIIISAIVVVVTVVVAFIGIVMEEGQNIRNDNVNHQ